MLLGQGEWTNQGSSVLHSVVTRGGSVMSLGSGSGFGSDQVFAWSTYFRSSSADVSKNVLLGELLQAAPSGTQLSRERLVTGTGSGTATGSGTGTGTSPGPSHFSSR